jgi:hypothetical protein
MAALYRRVLSSGTTATPAGHLLSKSLRETEDEWQRSKVPEHLPRQVAGLNMPILLKQDPWKLVQDCTMEIVGMTMLLSQGHRQKFNTKHWKVCLGLRVL